MLLELLKMEEQADAQLVHQPRLTAPKRSTPKRTPSKPKSTPITAGLVLFAAREVIRTKPARWLAAAAVIALCVLVALQFVGPNTTPDPLTNNTTPPNMPAESAQPILRDHPGITPVATLTAEHDAVWAPAGGASAPPANLSTGTKLHPGQTLTLTLTLTAGFAEITTAQGAIAILQAPATVEFTHNNNALELHSGKLVGICETETSKGFVVRTPHMDITDLGTRFGVEVKAIGETQTHVFEGSIEVTRNSSPQASDPPQPRVLLANEALAIDADGGLIDTPSTDPDRFAQALALHRSRPQLEGDIQWVSPDAYIGLASEDWPTLPHAVIFEEARDIALAQDMRGVGLPEIRRGDVVRSYVVLLNADRNHTRVKGRITFARPVHSVLRKTNVQKEFVKAAGLVNGHAPIPGVMNHDDDAAVAVDDPRAATFDMTHTDGQNLVRGHNLFRIVFIERDATSTP